MKQLWRFSVTMFAVLAFSSQARADLLYSNYDGGNPSDYGSPEYFSSMGTRLSTFAGAPPAGQWQLERIELNLRLLAGNSSDLRVSLYTSNGAPDAFVALLQPSIPVTVQANYSFSPTTPIVLDSGQPYEVVVEPAFAEGTSFAWYYAPGKFGGIRDDTDSPTSWAGNWDDIPDGPTVRVFANAVPEPQTIVLLITGLGLLGVWRSRMKIR